MEKLRKAEGAIKRTFEAIVPQVKGGFNEVPVMDHIEAEFEVKTLSEKPTGTWLGVQVKTDEGVATYNWNAAEMLSLDEHPIVEVDDSKMGIDETMLLTWTKDNPVRMFRAKA